MNKTKRFKLIVITLIFFVLIFLIISFGEKEAEENVKEKYEVSTIDTHAKEGYQELEKLEEEYKGYKRLKDTLMSNPDTKKKIEDFEKLRYEIQLMQYTGEEKDEEKNKKLQEMYGLLVQDTQIKEYFDMEVKFNVMIADVNKIIAEAIKDVL